MVSSFIFRDQDILRILTNVNNDVSSEKLRKLLIFKAPKVRTVFFFVFKKKKNSITEIDYNFVRIT